MTDFVELVFDCPFILLKGFLRGLITCKNEEVEYFFAKLHGIEAETLKESLKEWLGIESHVHLVVEKDFGEYLKEAIKKNYDKLKVKTVSEKEIKDAFFTFSISFFEEKGYESFENLIKQKAEDCNCSVNLEKSEVVEPITDDLGGGITPILPSKRYLISGKIQGYLPSVVKMREELIKEHAGDISKIKLIFKD